MLIVAIAWIYVVGMAAIAEALSPQGTLLGATFTFVLYGLAPLAVVLYLLATPARKKMRRQTEAEEAQAAGDAAPAAGVAPSAATLEPDRGGHAAAEARRPVAPE